MHSHRCTMTAGVALLLTLLMLAAGCGEDGGGTAPANRPPTVSVTLETNYEAMVAGDGVVLQAIGSDPDFDTLTYSWTIAPPTAGSFDDASARTVTWSPSSEVGEVTITCEVSDGEATGSASTAGGQLVIGTGVEAGTISTDTIWTGAASPYVVLGDLTVSPSATLTVEAGVTVYVRPFFVGQSWVRPRISIEGTLDATGTSGDPIRFEGGRFAHVQPTQHGGLLLGSAGVASLSYVTVRDGDVGLRTSSSENIELRRCQFSDNTNGFSADGGSTSTLIDCEIRDNLVSGIFVSGATVTVRSDLGAASQSRIRDNPGSGIIVGAPSSSIAFLSIESTQFSDNGQGHLTINNSGGGASVQATCSDFATVPEGTSKIVVQDPFCFALSLTLTGNFWGGSFTEPSPIVAFFDDLRFCDAEVDTWTLAGGDWSNNSALGSCTTGR